LGLGFGFWVLGLGLGFGWVAWIMDELFPTRCKCMVMVSPNEVKE